MCIVKEERKGKERKKEETALYERSHVNRHCMKLIKKDVPYL
jgi:hypothetical protein